jgi:ADP-heptose:LPS heptosyltransferase
MRTLVSGLGAFKIRMLLAIIGPRITAGRNTDGRGAFFDIAIPETVKGEKHEMEYDVELVERLGGKVEDKRIDYLIDDEGAKKARKILEEAGIADNDIVVGVHPGGKPSHRWPIGNFAEAMRQIAGKVNCSFIITGDSEEAPLADALAQTCGVKAMNTAGAVTIKEFGALVKRCRAFISNDTAAMHIAALSGVPLVAIFGPGYLLRFDPRKISDRAKVLYKKADCAPCDKETCASLGCLKSISPHEVAKAALALLGVEKEG